MRTLKVRLLEATQGAIMEVLEQNSVSCMDFDPEIKVVLGKITKEVKGQILERSCSSIKEEAFIRLEFGPFAESAYVTPGPFRRHSISDFKYGWVAPAL